MKRLLDIFGAFVVLITTHACATAAIYQYDYIGTDGSFSFVDSNTPVPTSFTPGLETTLYETGLLNGISARFRVTFATAFLNGGVIAAVDPFGVVFEQGPQLFMGDVSAPIFFKQSTDVAFLFDHGTFTVSEAEIPMSAVPEPSTWAMMLLGFGVLGFLAYGKLQAGSVRKSAVATV